MSISHYSQLAAIDMGSNSFHMVISRLEEGELRPIERLGNKVQLAAGLVDGVLTDEAMERGLACLQGFAQRLSNVSDDGLRVVGTNTLREARNADVFIAKAEDILGYPVNVLSGREEARLIYLGVAHSLSDDEEARLVIDIGGGSTELIIGSRFESRVMESLQMGCVAYLRYFPNGVICRDNFLQAYRAAALELLNVAEAYRGQWSNCIGSSGTLRAIEQLLVDLQLSVSGISVDGLIALQETLLTFKHVDKVNFTGVKPERCRLLAPGVAITKALFDTLHIDHMELSDGALREGVLYDLLGRLAHEDVRERTVLALEKRYDVDTGDAGTVDYLALAVLDQVNSEWNIKRQRDRRLLSWAARLHSIGLMVSHSDFHKHGEYLIRQSDLMGFSRQEQRNLAILVRLHRRKPSMEVFDGVIDTESVKLFRLAVVLRLAIVLRHALNIESTLPCTFDASGEKKLYIKFAPNWLESHPLTATQLTTEKKYLATVNFKLTVE